MPPFYLTPLSVMKHYYILFLLSFLSLGSFGQTYTTTEAYVYDEFQGQYILQHKVIREFPEGLTPIVNKKKMNFHPLIIGADSDRNDLIKDLSEEFYPVYYYYENSSKVTYMEYYDGELDDSVVYDLVRREDTLFDGDYSYVVKHPQLMSYHGDEGEFSQRSYPYEEADTSVSSYYNLDSSRNFSATYYSREAYDESGYFIEDLNVVKKCLDDNCTLFNIDSAYLVFEYTTEGYLDQMIEYGSVDAPMEELGRFVVERNSNNEITGISDGTYDFSWDGLSREVVIREDYSTSVLRFDGVDYKLDSVVTKLGRPDDIVSLDETKDADIGVYPNPSSGNVTVLLSTSNEVKVEVYNVLGNMVTSKLGSKEIEFTNLEEGLYVLKFSTNEGVSSQHVQIVK